jgi:hypothetical protein
MGVPGNANALLLKSVGAGDTAYKIERSLRFSSADSSYLNRTFSSGNRKTWTWAGWIKRISPSGSFMFLFGRFNVDGTIGHVIDFGNDTIRVKYAPSGSYSNDTYTSAVFRDYSAWMHVVVAFDTTQSVQADRLKIYVNGTQQTLTNNTWSLNTDYLINGADSHSIGRAGDYTSQYFDGYLADIYFIDGQALTPSSFTTTDGTTGQLIPKAFTGSYGTNGFHLDLADNSSLTTSSNVGIGKDTSGNGNYWVTNNLSITAGTGNDSLVDSPTNYGTSTGIGGEVRGNYCTLNPIDSNSGHSLTNGNLTISGSTSNWRHTRSTFSIPTSDKWYAEFTISALNVTENTIIGFAPSTLSLSTYVGGGSNSIGFQCNSNIWTNGSSASGGATYAANDIMQIAVDRATGKAWLGKNGTWVSSGNPAAGTNATSSSVATSGELFFAVSIYSSFNSVVCNFGQRTFAYTVPSGFKVLCSTNLPSTTITTSGTYTGNGSADGPFVFLNGVPTAMTVGGNAVTFGTHADKLSNGFKIRTTSTTYNQNTSSYSYSITTAGDAFKYARAQPN